MVERRKITVLDRSYDVYIYDEMRNNTRASITKTRIIIRVSRFLGRKNRENEISKMLNWAEIRLKIKPTLKINNPVYEHGGYLRTHSKIYRFDIEKRDSIKNFSKIEGNTLKFKISHKHDHDTSQNYISKQTRKLLANAHLDQLKTHVNYLNDKHFKQKINNISYKYTKSRWGACKIKKRHIELSTRLLLAPYSVTEYVIVHELTHLIVPNHSKDFWNIVKKAYPNYKEKSAWLKLNGHKLVI